MSKKLKDGEPMTKENTAALSEPNAEAIMESLPSSTVSPPPDLPPPPEQEKAFVVVAKFPKHSDANNFAANEAKRSFAQLGIDAHIVDTIDGSGERHLLVDCSAGLKVAK